MKLSTVAIIAYEAVRAFAKEHGDNHHRRWGKLSEEHQKSLIEGAMFHFINPQIGPEAAHLARCKRLMEQGWSFGPEKDEEKKLTPLLVAYSDLPPERQFKYFIFAVVAGNLAQFVEDGPTPPALEVIPSDPLGFGAQIQVSEKDFDIDPDFGSNAEQPHEPEEIDEADKDKPHVGVGGAAPQGEPGSTSATQSPSEQTTEDSSASEPPETSHSSSSASTSESHGVSSAPSGETESSSASTADAA